MVGMNEQQLHFDCYTLEEGGLRYASQHRREYLKMARHIAPNLRSPTEVWDRVAFAILSANCRFECSVRGLEYARTCRGRVMGKELVRVGGGMVEQRAGYLNALPPVMGLLKTEREGWHQYRARLAGVRGLGITKASFAACLLYPFEAEVCCLDVWMLRGLAEAAPKRLRTYETIESRVCQYARLIDLPVFVTQWALWDWLRGKLEPHNIFQRETIHA